MKDLSDIQLRDNAGVAMALIRGTPNGAVEDQVFVDATRDAIATIGLSRQTLLSSSNIGADVLYYTIDDQGNKIEGIDLIQGVLDSGEPFSRVGYYRFAHNSSDWHKDVLTITRVAPEHILLIQHDISQTDPRLQWINRIDPRPDVNKLFLDNGSVITWEQYQTLHRVMRGQSYKQIARLTDISPKTVNYRLDRIKAAFEVETLGELMEAVFTNGLVHLVTLPLEEQARCGSKEELLALLQRHHGEVTYTGASR